MKAVRVDAFGRPPVIVELAEPTAGPGRTLVRVHAATVGHIDRSIWSGAFFRHPPLPYTPGVEAAGTVVASEVFPTGTRVWVRGGGLGTVEDGTWAELVAAPDSALGLLPDEVDESIGAAFFSPCSSAWVSLHDVARSQPGETVLVTGATGAVGSVAVQLALEHGSEVIATVSSAEKAARLPDRARGLVLDRERPIVPDGLEADVLIDTVGGPLLGALIPTLRSGGRAVLVGYLAGSDIAVDVGSLVQRDVALLPLNMIHREGAGRAAAPLLLERLADGRLQLPVTTFALSEVGEAMAWLASGTQVGRAVLLPQVGR